MTGFSNPALSKSVRWIIATIGVVVLVSVYGVWRTIDQKTGGGFWSGALRGALVFGGIGLLWAWAKRDGGKKSGMVSEQPPAAQIPVQPQATPATPAPLQQRAPSAPTPASTAPTSVDEDAIYTTIAHELETGATDKGLWTRLYAECDGNEIKIKVRYIETRASQLRRQQSSASFKAPLVDDPTTIESAVEPIVEDDDQLMKRFGVRKAGDQFEFRSYRYERLEDAIAYSQMMVSRGEVVSPVPDDSIAELKRGLVATPIPKPPIHLRELALPQDCNDVLTHLGYKLSGGDSGPWRIQEPRGGRVKLTTFTELAEYAASRQASIR